MQIPLKQGLLEMAPKFRDAQTGRSPGSPCKFQQPQPTHQPANSFANMSLKHTYKYSIPIPIKKTPTEKKTYTLEN